MEDRITTAEVIVDYAHHEVHSGRHFHLSHSVADIGALSTPNDAMTISWKTPDTPRLIHLVFSATSASGGLFKFVEGKTGGGESPTGVIQSYNSNRGSAITSGILDVAGANASKASYDATLFTGGAELVAEYIGASGLGNTFSGGNTRAEQEWILARNTFYQLSIYNTANVPGTIQMSWYEHVSRNT